MIRSLGVAALPFLALASCGHSAATTLHSLGAIPPSRVDPHYAGAPVRVDAVRLPPAIDRIEMLRETADDRYTVLEFDRWAAPPTRLARQALIEDLTARLPEGAVISTVDNDGPPVTVITVDFLSFSARSGEAEAIANWTGGCRPGTIDRRRTVQLRAPAGDMPAALEGLLGELADDIAADLNASPEAACARKSVAASTAPMSRQKGR